MLLCELPGLVNPSGSFGGLTLRVLLPDAYRLHG